MGDSSDQRKPIRLSAELHEKLKDAQYEERKRSGKEPSMTELLERAWERQAAAPASTPAPAAKGYPYPATKEWHEMLETILQQGTERQKLGIQSNLEAFIGNIAPVARPTKKAKAS